MLEEYDEAFSEMDGEGSEDVRAIQLPGLIELTQMDNILPLLEDDTVKTEIAQRVIDGFDVDEQSREDWLKRAEAGVKLAAQHKEAKSYPWDGAANAMHPLITQASMQFNARTLPAILPEGDVVKTAVHGKDAKGEKQKRGNRVSQFMSYQLRYKVRGWEDDTDALLARLPNEGHLFRKISYDIPRRKVVTKLYSAAQVVVNESAESLERAPRISEILELYPAEIVERIRLGLYIEFDWRNAPPANENEKGDHDWQKDKDAPQEFIQQYLRYDLDGDGYPEPYICVVHKSTQKLVRIIANFTPESIIAEMEEPDPMAPDAEPRIKTVIAIEPETFFIDYRFFPSLDGGYHGVGLGHLVGNNVELVNTTINQLLDSGHLASLGAGFIGRGINLGSGLQRVRPGEWKNINASGDDIRKAMVQLDFPGPSPVLFQLLGLLVETAKDVASINNIMGGEAPPANQPAATTLAMIEQGMQVFVAVYKRIYKSLTKEFTLLAKINARFLDPQEYAEFHDLRVDPEPGQPPEAMQQGQQQLDPAQEFDLKNMDIEPIASPRAASAIQELAKAQMLLEMAAGGVVDPREATIRVLRAAGYDDIEELVPTPDPQQQQMQMRKAQLIEQLQMRGMQAGVMKTEAEAQEKQAATIERQAGAKQKEASALKTIADAEAAEEGQNIEQYQREIDRVMEQRKLDLEELSIIERLQDNDYRRRTERMAAVTRNRSGSGGS